MQSLSRDMLAGGHFTEKDGVAKTFLAFRSCREFRGCQRVPFEFQ